MDIDKLLNSLEPTNEDKIQYLKEYIVKLDREELLTFCSNMLDIINQLPKNA